MDKVTVALTVLRSVGNAGYFLFDNLMWFGTCADLRARYCLSNFFDRVYLLFVSLFCSTTAKYNIPLVKGKSAPYWFKVGFAFWLLAICSGLALDTYTLPAADSTVALRQFSKNLCDLPIALNGTFELGWSNGLTGALGIWSSLVTAYQLWPAS